MKNKKKVLITGVVLIVGVGVAILAGTYAFEKHDKQNESKMEMEQGATQLEEMEKLADSENSPVIGKEEVKSIVADKMNLDPNTLNDDNFKLQLVRKEKIKESFKIDTDQMGDDNFIYVADVDENVQKMGFIIGSKTGEIYQATSNLNGSCGM